MSYQPPTLKSNAHNRTPPPKQRTPFIIKKSTIEEYEDFCRETWGLSSEDVYYRNMVAQYTEGYLTYSSPKSSKPRFKEYAQYKHFIEDEELYAHYLTLGELSNTIFPSNQDC